METTYALWIVPRGKMHQQIHSYVQLFSKQYGAPVFEPHITLHWPVKGTRTEAIAQAKEVASKLKPFTFTLTEVDYTEEFGRCLFLSTDRSAELLHANAVTREVCRATSNEEYAPHMSLTYGIFPPEIKEEMIRLIGKEHNLELDVPAIQLWDVGIQQKDAPLVQWRFVEEFPLR
jgi:2'-5' RNA ligase